MARMVRQSRSPIPPEFSEEFTKCKSYPAYFIDNYCYIYDAVSGEWIPFKIWREQYETLNEIHGNQFTIILKARQLGFTWLVIAYTLWLMMFRPIATVLLLSKGDTEAMELLSDFRLKGMEMRLPYWLRVPVVSDNAHTLEFKNGSRALSFPTTGGRSYTATMAVIDEADKLPPTAKEKRSLLMQLIESVKPTVDAGGKLVLISTSDKAKPQSLFKSIYRAAKAGKNRYKAVFHGWSVRPARTQEWYDRESRETLATTGSLDYMHQEYPASDVEALAPKVLDKRIAPQWLEQCYLELDPITKLPESCPSIPGLVVYHLPLMERNEGPKRYVIGGDPAEGNPTSDDSSAHVLDFETGEEVASLTGKFQPSAFANYIDQLGQWYCGAAVMVERNNHGHAVLMWLEEHSPLPLLTGHDGNVGWLSSTKGKALLYDAGADAFRNQETTLHSFETHMQLASIEGSTLRAPEGEQDDRADSYVMALVGITKAGQELWGNFRFQVIQGARAVELRQGANLR